MNLNILNGAFVVFCTAVVLMGVATNANAQDPRRGYNVGVGAQGTDMWTQSMSGLRLFTPHRNNCDDTTTPTEVFIKIYTNSNNVDFGFCMDLDEHSSGAKEWEDARHQCISEGKRLPEPGEFKYACDNAGTLGLNNMTDDAEFVSNFPRYVPNLSSKQGQIAPHAGAGSCKHMAGYWIGNTSSTNATGPFRCVR